MLPPGVHPELPPEITISGTVFCYAKRRPNILKQRQKGDKVMLVTTYFVAGRPAGAAANGTFGDDEGKWMGVFTALVDICECRRHVSPIEPGAACDVS
jgi:hypothetical protein